MRTVAQFDELRVWQHGVKLNETDDPYARGVGEWIGFAEAVCLFVLGFFFFHYREALTCAQMHVEPDEGQESKEKRSEST